MKTNGIIYLHKNKVNGKCYIGQTFQKPNERWKNGNGYRNQPKFYNAILKYGWDNFEHIILEQNLSEDIIDEREKYWIDYYKSFLPENGYNLTLGGDGASPGIFNNSAKLNQEKLNELIKDLIDNVIFIKVLSKRWRSHCGVSRRHNVL